MSFLRYLVLVIIVLSALIFLVCWRQKKADFRQGARLAEKGVSWEEADKIQRKKKNIVYTEMFWRGYESFFQKK